MQLLEREGEFSIKNLLNPHHSRQGIGSKKSLADRNAEGVKVKKVVMQ